MFNLNIKLHEQTPQISQSYMPAKEIQVLMNPEKETIQTPELVHKK
jgi:stress response protein YsnF